MSINITGYNVSHLVCYVKRHNENLLRSDYFMVKNRLREIREKRSLSQNQLAKMTGIDQSQISRFQQGRLMREDDIRKFCQALECKADYLLGLIDDEENKEEKG